MRYTLMRTMLCDCRTLTGMICYIRESDLHLYLQWYVITCISITLWCSHWEMSFITTQVFSIPRIVVSFYLLLLLLHLCQYNFLMWYPCLNVRFVLFSTDTVKFSFFQLPFICYTVWATNQHLPAVWYEQLEMCSVNSNIAKSVFNSVLSPFFTCSYIILCDSGVIEIQTTVLIMFGSYPFID